MKKTLAMLLCAVMLLGTVSTAAFADDADPLASILEELRVSQINAILSVYHDAFENYAEQLASAWQPFEVVFDEDHIYVIQDAEDYASLLTGLFISNIAYNLGDNYATASVAEFYEASVTVYEYICAVVYHGAQQLYVRRTAAAIVEAIIASYPEGYDYHDDPAFQWVAALS